MTDLPPIPALPDETREGAALAVIDHAIGHPARETDWDRAYEAVAAVIAEAWPAMYAAALRHAADSDRLLNSTVDLACAHQAITELGRMADEALTGG